MQISGMSEEADPHLKEGAPDPLHRSKGERVPFGSILLPRGAATDATLVTIDAGSTAGLVVSVPRLFIQIHKTKQREGAVCRCGFTLCSLHTC